MRVRFSTGRQHKEPRLSGSGLCWLYSWGASSRLLLQLVAALRNSRCRESLTQLAAEQHCVRWTTNDSGMRAGLLGLLVVASTAYSRSGVLMKEPLRNQIVQAVQQRMRSFEAAERSLSCRGLSIDYTQVFAPHFETARRRLTAVSVI